MSAHHEQLKRKMNLGDVFGTWTVIVAVNGREYESTVQCECGTVRNVKNIKLWEGELKTCCCNRQFLKTLSPTERKIYERLRGMIRRCYDKSRREYKWYGGRGIYVADEWRNSPQAFIDWSLANGFHENLDIGRKDNDGPYSPENCEWSTITDNACNKRTTRYLTCLGETKSLTQWSRDPRCKVNYKRLEKRIHKGWEHQRAILTPPDQRFNSYRPTLTQPIATGTTTISKK